MNSGSRSRPNKPICDVKARLHREWATATSEYCQAVALLESRLSMLSRDEYNLIRAICIRARHEAEECIQALEAHIWAHGC